MNSFNFESFIEMLRRKWSRYLDDELIQDLEDYWYRGRLYRASSLAATLCRKIPDRYLQLNPDIQNGFEAIQQATGNRLEKASPSRLPVVERSSTPKKRPYSPRKYDESGKTDTEHDTFQDYLNVLAKGVVENNENYLQYVQTMCDERTPMIRDLHKIACSTSELFRRLKTRDITMVTCITWYKDALASLLKMDFGVIPYISEEATLYKNEVNIFDSNIALLQKLQYLLRSFGEQAGIDRDNTGLNERISTLQNQLQVKDLQLTKETKMSNDLEKHNKELSAQLMEAERQRKRLEQTKSDYEEKDILQLLDRNDELQRQLEERDRDLRQLSKDLRQLQQEEEHFQKRLSQIKAEKDDQETTNTRLEVKISTLQNQLQVKDLQLTKETKMSNDLEKHNKELSAQISTLQNQLQVKDLQLTKETKMSNDLEKHNKELSAQLMEAERQRKRLEQTKSDYEEKDILQLLDRLSQIKAEKDDQETTNTRLEVKLQKALDQINQLHQNDTRSNSYEERINHLQKRLQQIDTEKSVKKRTIDQLESEKAELHEKYIHLLNQLKEQEREAQEMKSKLRQSNQTIAELQISFTKVEAQKSDILDNRKRELEGENITLEEKLTKFEREKLDAEKTLKQLQKEKTTFEDKYTQSKEQLGRLQRDLQRLETKYNQTKDSKIDLQEKLLKAEDQIRQFKQDGIESETHRDIQNRNEQLQKQLDQNQIELQRMKTDLQKIQGKNEDLQNRLGTVGREKLDNEKTMTKLEREKTRFEDENLQLVEQLDRLKVEIKTMTTDVNQTKESKYDLQDRLRMVETEKSKKDNELKGLKREKTTLEEKLHEAERERKMQRHELDGARSNFNSSGNGSRHESQRNEQLQKELEHKQMALQRMKTELQKTQAKNEDLQSRFSRVAAAQLTHDNPNIADLSDKNRPTKIGEQFSELYDNEWTEAFTAIEDSPGNTASEEEIVTKLRDILLNCFKQCADISKKQIEGIKAMLLSPSRSDSTSTPRTLSTEQAKSLTDLRKQTTHLAMESIKKEMCKTFGVTSQHRDMKLFIERCTELCWLMVIQSPPVVIDDRHRPGDRFDKDVFKAYTKAGKVIDFVVWPPIFLHNGGPLLCKGTAQGKN